MKLVCQDEPGKTGMSYNRLSYQGNIYPAGNEIQNEHRKVQKAKVIRLFPLDSSGRRLSRQRRDVTFLAFMQHQIERLQSTGRLGTARNYTRTLNSFAGFLGGKDPLLRSFNEQLVEDYQTYLKLRGVMRNTASFYMRILRAVYNKAVRQSLIRQKFPFRNVYTGIDRTRKRAVDERVLERMNRLDLRHSASLELARDLFVFSYCTRGMSFVDMAYLRKTDVKNGVIRYTRHKTNQQLIVQIEPCMQQIIERYRQQSHDSPYVFPMLISDDPQKAYIQYQNSLNYYNRLLKKLSGLLNLKYGLSSYSARHSWATAARNHNVPLSVISAGMGHNSERTTQIYLSMLENSTIDVANQGIIAALNCPVSL